MGPRGDNLLRMAKAVAPMLLGFLGVVLLAMPLRLFEGFAPTPILPLAIVFFWSIYAPDFMPPPGVFLIGLSQDLLNGGPIGLWAMVYLVTQYVVLSQRAYFLGREPKVVWIGFGFAAAAAGVMIWLIMSLLAGALLPVWGLIGQLAVTIAIYPAFNAVFGQLHLRVLVES